MNRTSEALCAALGEDAGRVPALSPDEWREVATLAIRQRVGPLLLSRSHLPFPDDVRAQLRARADTSAKRGLQQMAAFRELSEAAAARGLTVVALKGLHLAACVYPSPGLREMGDIDVLVPTGDLDAVAAVARQLGYTEDVSGGVAHHHLPPMVRGRVCIEIHWQLFQDDLGQVADAEGLLARAVPSRLSPTTRTLCPEDLLLHICVHAAEHHVLDTGLRPLCDVQAILRQYGDTLDWEAVVERAHSWNVTRSVALVIALAHRHLGVPVPAGVQPLLAAAMPPAELLDEAMDFLFEHAVHLSGTSEAARQLLEIRGTRARLRHVVTQLWRPHTTRPQGAGLEDGVVGRMRSTAARAVGVSWRHGGWLWRASRDRTSPMHQALERRNTLAAWIRGEADVK